MHFQPKMPENGRENLFIENQTRNMIKITVLADINKKIKCTWCHLECKLKQGWYG